MKSVSRKEFWIGIFIALLTIGVNMWQTHYQISAIKEQNRCSYRSQFLKQVSDAVNNVCEQLESQASMYMEKEQCIMKEKAAEKCWAGKDKFNRLSSQRAWRNLDSTLAAATPLIEGTKSKEVLEDLVKIGKSHSDRVRALLQDESAEGTKRLRLEVLNTRQQLFDLRDKCREVLIQP